MIIIKLGGSVITDKTKPDSFKQNIMDRLSKEIKKANKETIIVHGAGSYGHILAKKYNLNEGYKSDDQKLGFSQTHEKVQKLNMMVINSLQKHGINAVSISPHSIMVLNDHKPTKMDYKIFQDFLKKGFVPVSFGDVVLDEKLGFSICSGDLLMELLSRYFKPEKVVFVIDEDGLYTSNPKKDKNAKLIDSTTFDEFENFTTKMDSHADVTGGMAGKLQTIENISKNGVDTYLVNGNKPNRLYQVLVGRKTICTVVHGGKK